MSLPKPTKFYGSRGAAGGNPRRLKWALLEKGIETEDIHAGDMSPAEVKFPILAQKFPRPANTIPVLELEDGSWIGNCSAAMRYLEQYKPSGGVPLYGKSPAEAAQVAQFEHMAYEDGVLPLQESLRNKAALVKAVGSTMPGIAGIGRIPELEERGKQRWEQFAAWLENHLNGKEYMCGADFSAADITLGYALSITPALMGKTYLQEKEGPNLQRYWKSVSARPAFAASASKDTVAKMKDASKL